MRYGHGSGGLVAPLHTAVLAERYVGASVNQRLVGVVVVREQALLELALVKEDVPYNLPRLFIATNNSLFTPYRLTTPLSTVEISIRLYWFSLCTPFILPSGRI